MSKLNCSSRKPTNFICELFDVSFIVGADELEFEAHKFVLATASQVFKNMFYGPKQEMTKKPIIIPDVQPDTFTLILHFAYRNDCIFPSVNDALCCIYVAEKYQMYKLISRCIKYLDEMMNLNNICVICQSAEQLAQYDLSQKCEDYVFRNVVQVLTSEGFVKFPEDIVLKISKKMSEKVNPVLMFGCLLKWCNYQIEYWHDCDPLALRKKMSKFLPYILLSTMTPEDFCASVAVTGVLSDSDVVAILMNLHNVDGRSLPEWFNVNDKMEATPMQCNERKSSKYDES